MTIRAGDARSRRDDRPVHRHRARSGSRTSRTRSVHRARIETCGTSRSRGWGAMPGTALRRSLPRSDRADRAISACDRRESHRLVGIRQRRSRRAPRHDPRRTRTDPWHLRRTPADRASSRRRWGPLGALRTGRNRSRSSVRPGQRKEAASCSVEIDPRCPAFHGLPPRSNFFQFHYWQLDDIPAGFAIRAHSPWSTIQAVERHDRPVFGVQFHPERYDSVHPVGATVLRNFFALTGSYPRATR